MCWKVNLVISVTHFIVSTINCEMYNHQISCHNFGINKFAQIHLTIFFIFFRRDTSQYGAFRRAKTTPSHCQEPAAGPVSVEAVFVAFCLVWQLFSHAALALIHFAAPLLGAPVSAQWLNRFFRILLRRWPLQGVLAHPAACAERSCVPSNGIRLAALRSIEVDFCK